MPKPKTARLLLAAGALVLVVASLTIYHSNHVARTTLTPPAAQPAAVPPALDPLTIAAMRARTYTASAITTEQNLGEQGGYSNQIVSYRSDNLKVYALLSLPDGSPPSGGWPVIILDHGYINPASYLTNGPEYRGFITALAQAGYAVIKPDYRGHGRSEGLPEGGHFSPVYAYDNLNLIASLKQFPTVNPNRIGLFGHSLGGHVALRTIVTAADVKATVLAAGVVGSFSDIFYNWPNSPMPYDQPQSLVQATKQKLINQYGEPKTNPAFWDSASSLNFVGNVSGAVQVNHDSGDSVVPQLFSDHLVAALRAAAKPVEYNLYPGNDHQFITSRAKLLQNMLAFYRSNL